MEPTREAALARMHEFVPRMGGHYMQHRNHDLGPADRTNVSNLSPWIRRRLVLESEVAQAALDEHGPRAAEKFVQEVVWRTYWKGWLEQRPQVWDDYLYELADEIEKLDRYGDARADYERAVEGRTGIEPFDDWARELIETGTLHNHARMWFASIWVFTLRLHWTLGADFFLRHLLDGDPASNTLSWRWVAGLHTSGKHYLATSDNIAKFTGGRYRLPKNALAGGVDAPEWEPVERHPLPRPEKPKDVPSLLLVTEDDCSPMTLDLPPVTRAIVVPSAHRRSPLDVGEKVLAFERGALVDAAARLGENGIEAELVEADALAETIERLAPRQIVGAELPVGPARDALLPILADVEAPFRPTRRPWDEKFWPHATAGFFKLKKAIPKVFAELAREGDKSTERT